ncbi:MAG: hypothetical protein Tsb0014_07880 [Pleurocapsa sp.]
MALLKIADLYPSYKEDIFGGDDIKNFSVYDYSNDKIGSVHDILVDESGRFRYLVIDTGFWIFGKKVLLPVGRASIDYAQERVYASGLSKEQAEHLPEYDDDMTIDYDYEERVRTTYRGVDYDRNNPVYSPQNGAYDSGAYTYDRDPELYQLTTANHGNFMGYEESFMNHRDRFNLRSGVNLYKISDLYPDYHSLFSNDDLMSYSLYSDSDEKVGSIKDILVDRDGHFRYLVVDTGFWIFGKKVLLPFGRARIDSSQKRVYATGLTKEQAEHLPEYDSDMTVDYDYEERVRNVYRGQSSTMGDLGKGSALRDRNSYSYDHEPSLYAHQETEGRQSLKLYEERLVANKERFRTGAVTVGKKVETETATVSVPVEKERVVIERNAATDTKAVTPGSVSFKEGEVARVEVYEESAEIEKQAFVREEVSVRKEVEKDTVSARETVRREELDIETDGEVVVNRDR